MSSFSDFVAVVETRNRVQEQARAAQSRENKARAMWFGKWVGIPLVAVTIGAIVFWQIHSARWWNGMVSDAWETGEFAGFRYRDGLSWAAYSKTDTEKFTTILIVPYEIKGDARRPNGIAPSGCVNGNVVVFRQRKGVGKIATYGQKRRLCVPAAATAQFQTYLDTK